MPDELTQVMRWEEQNRNFFHYIVKGQYFWKAKKALARSPPFPPPPLPLCLLSFLLFFLVYSFRERPQCHYLKRSLCVTSSNPFVLTQTVDWGALTRFGLPSLHSSCTFSQRCNDPHYSLLPLNATVNVQSCTCYTLLGTSPARQKSTNGTGSSITHSSLSFLSKTHSYSVSAWLCMFLWFFLIKILQMLVAASLLDCYINLKHFYPSHS